MNSWWSAIGGGAEENGVDKMNFGENRGNSRGRQLEGQRTSMSANNLHWSCQEKNTFLQNIHTRMKPCNVSLHNTIRAKCKRVVELGCI